MAALIEQTLGLTLISLAVGYLLCRWLLPAVQAHTKLPEGASQLDGQDWRASRIIRRGSGLARDANTPKPANSQDVAPAVA